MKLYKVLVNGRSCHGGVMEWSLPRRGRPGRRHEYDGILSPCASGLHLTRDYTKWLKVGCEIYEAEASGESVDCGDDKIVCSQVRLVRRIATPLWWRRVERFVGSIKNVPFFSMTGDVRPEWKVFRAKTWPAALDAAYAAALDAARAAAYAAAYAAALDAARDAAYAARAAALDAAYAAARDAAYAAARDAAYAAALDAALYTGSLIAPKGTIAQKHIDHIKARWDVWRRGYGLLCDVNGVLYVYGVAV